MFPALFRVFLDTNVLFPSALRDTLLRTAETGLVQVYLLDGLARSVPGFIVEVRAWLAEREAP